MDESRKEVVAVVVMGTVFALLSNWNSNYCSLPWKPISTIFVFLFIPLVGGMVYVRRLRRSGREVSYPMLSWSAVYWFTVMILSVLVSGALQGFGYR